LAHHTTFNFEATVDLDTVACLNTDTQLASTTRRHNELQQHGANLFPPVMEISRNQTEMSDDHEMQQRCRLLELPSEVRLIIYGMAFPSRRTSLYAAAELFRSGQKNTHRSVALLATCRAIYTEAQPVLYENTEFKIWCTSAEDSGHLKNILSARPLIGQMRKLLVQITLADSEPLVDPDNERKWYQTLTSELILLDEAPHLKNIHIELDAWYGGTHVVAAFDHAMSQLSTLKYRFAPTVSIDSTLRDTDLEPSSYHDMLTRLGW
jgi:hypothetical protein